MIAGRRHFTNAAAVLASDAYAVLYARGLPVGQQATLTLFADWFKATFPRVEAVREVKRQVEFDFGQTQSLEHHNADFNELLEKLPTGAQLLGQPTHIDHYLASLSEALPAELAEYDTPRKTVEDAHATIDHGHGYATLTLVQAAAIEAEKMVAAAGRKLGQQQPWLSIT